MLEYHGCNPTRGRGDFQGGMPEKGLTGAASSRAGEGRDPGAGLRKQVVEERTIFIRVLSPSPNVAPVSFPRIAAIPISSNVNYCHIPLFLTDIPPRPTAWLQNDARSLQTRAPKLRRGEGSRAQLSKRTIG